MFAKNKNLFIYFKIFQVRFTSALKYFLTAFILLGQKDLLFVSRNFNGAAYIQPANELKDCGNLKKSFGLVSLA